MIGFTFHFIATDVPKAIKVLFLSLLIRYSKETAGWVYATSWSNPFRRDLSNIIIEKINLLKRNEDEEV